ncbi:uncharacterized protein LOC123657496 [Melitaea cinxia]|uniref:uncharacterized protein LOC123657496 n=1 Tax=Melitaea cinxia TaxID=113334 RepID=UPI001E270AD3|nr:uncharacterized protein LOC123657496 [Melitaea cinxia]
MVYLWLVVHACSSSAEDVFERLYSDASRRVTVCCERGHMCPAARWRRDWLVARVSCLLSHPYYPSLRAKEGVDNCTDDSAVTRKYEMRTMRYIVSHHTHPSYPNVDLMLLRINCPWDTELIDNRTLTISDAIFDRLDSWIKAINFNKVFTTTKPKNIMQRTHLQMYSTPVRMFLVTVVLPSISFIVFFLFVIFFTGTSKGSNIPYKNLNSGKKETSYV